MKFNQPFLDALSIDGIRKVIDYFGNWCKPIDRYRDYVEDREHNWNIDDLEKGQVIDFVIRNKDELDFNTNDFEDVAMVMRRKTDDELGGEDNNILQVEYHTRRCATEPGHAADHRAHLRQSLLVGQHSIRPHLGTGVPDRNYSFHRDGYGTGPLITKNLTRLALCQLPNGEVPILRTNGDGTLYKGYSLDKVSWEKGIGINDHDVSSDTSIGCITTPPGILRQAKCDDEYIYKYRPTLDAAIVKNYGIICLINATTLTNICAELNIDASMCKIK